MVIFCEKIPADIKIYEHPPPTKLQSQANFQFWAFCSSCATVQRMIALPPTHPHTQLAHLMPMPREPQRIPLRNLIHGVTSILDISAEMILITTTPLNPTGVYPHMPIAVTTSGG